MKKIIYLFAFAVLLSSCSKKVTSVTRTSTTETTVDSAKAVAAVQTITEVKDSAKAEINAEEVKKAIETKKEVKTQTVKDGIRVTLKIDTTGAATATAVIDTTIKKTDSVGYWQRYTTTVNSQYEQLRTNELSFWDRTAKKLFWPLMFLVAILILILRHRR
jgi:PBP1b-binding outer membrane lipoprotein LpoB